MATSDCQVSSHEIKHYRQKFDSYFLELKIMILERSKKKED